MKNDKHALDQLFATTSLGGPEKAVGFVLWRIVHRYQREIDRSLATVDLTHLQFTTLAMTAWWTRSGASLTQVELAEYCDIQPMQISHMLKALESKGLVARRRSPSDVRAKSIEVTPAGATVLYRALPIAMAVQRRMFGDDGLPGGKLLAALLRLEERQAQAERSGSL